MHSGPQRALGDRNALVVAISAQKGGVGKTTTAVHLASALVRHEAQRVLLLDLDPQNHVASALRSSIPARGPALGAILQQQDPPGDLMDAVQPTTLAGLDCLAPDPDLAACENLLATRIGKEFILREALRVARTWYDVIVLDCPPHLGNLTANGLVAADRVLIPCELAPLAAEGVEQLLRTIAHLSERLHPGLDLIGLLRTRYDLRNARMNELVESDLQQRLGADLMIPIVISTSQAVARAQRAGVDLFEEDPRGRATRQYRELAAWLMQHHVRGPRA
jgi:chromosome partitioning protein